MDNRAEFEVESLESRKMMAGDVSVSVTDGDLVINGDNENNEFMIIGTGVDSPYDIIGVNGTSINGQSAITVDELTDDIRINLKNGDNTLGLSNVYAKDRMRVRTGKGNDTIVLEESGAKRMLNINSGSGDDSIYLYRSGSRRIDVRTGAGNDELALDNSQTQYLNAKTGGGNDEMYVGDTTFVFHARTNLGAGADKLMFQPGIAFGDDVRFVGGGGSDAYGGNGAVFQSFEVVGVTVDTLSHFIDFGVGQIESRIDLDAPI